MTGPPVPHPINALGDNAIGGFGIGQGPSVTGDLPPFDVWKTVLMQYANSPTVTALLTNFDQAVDLTRLFDQFFDLIWNVDTAQGPGLDVWGRIVNVSRTLTIRNVSFFGFQEAGITMQTFGYGVFFADENTTENYVLSDSAYRTLIFAKALANICDGSIPAINNLLMSLFPNQGNAYVIDGGGVASGPPNFGFQEAVDGSGDIDTFGTPSPFYPEVLTSNMSMVYAFQFVLNPIQQAIVEQSGVIPRPAGVSATILEAAAPS